MKHQIRDRGEELRKSGDERGEREPQTASSLLSLSRLRCVSGLRRSNDVVDGFRRCRKSRGRALDIRSPYRFSWPFDFSPFSFHETRFSLADLLSSSSIHDVPSLLIFRLSLNTFQVGKFSELFFPRRRTTFHKFLSPLKGSPLCVRDGIFSPQFP